jgi:subtilase family serine protease
VARPKFDVGRLDPNTKLEGVSLLFKESSAQKAASRRLLGDLQNPMSPRYHSWLRPADVAASFGASDADIGAATAWLLAQGFKVSGPSPTKTRLFFSGTVGQLEQAFLTEMHRYEVRGEHHFAMSVAPSVPDRLASVVLGLRGVHDFHLHPNLASRPKAVPQDLFDAGSKHGANSDVLTLDPSDFATIYDLNPLYAAGIDGTGQKIGIMGEGDFNDADMVAFRAAFDLNTANTPIRDLVPSSGLSTVSEYAFGETELDLEWSGAVAKNATVYYVYTGDNPAYSVYDAVNWAIEEGTYPVLSISYGGCELEFTPSENLYLETMGDAASMEGITVLNAAGDLGPATCDEDNESEKAAVTGLSVSWPASIPSIVAVGGTMLDWGDAIPQPILSPPVTTVAPFDTYWNCSFSAPGDCTPSGYVTETAWNETAYEIGHFDYFWGAGGGGISTLFTKPYWQVGQTPSGPMRMLPDVSLLAAYAQVGYMVSMSWTAADGPSQPPSPEALSITGGTSAASPSFSGIVALVNQALALKNPSSPVGLGNANPVLYALNASTKGTAAPAFHDITAGNTYVPCASGSPDCPTTGTQQIGYPAGVGYDLATGIGSVDVNNLVTAWTTLIPTAVTLTITPSGTTDGSATALAATVASNAPATGSVMTGSVVFYVDTVDEGGLSDLSLAATATLTSTTTGGLEGGTATATVTIPPGVLGQGNVVAFFAGDAHYLASWSSAQTKTSTSGFAVSPASVTLAPNQLQTFTTTGGVAPVQWNIVRDSTCNAMYYCSYVEQLTATSGAFEAGPEDGTTELAAVDADGAEIRIQVTVSGAPIDGGTLPPPFGYEAGIDASDASESDDGATEDVVSGNDAAADARVAADASADARAVPDASTLDSGSRADASTKPAEADSGCSCSTLGSQPRSAPGGAALGLAIGLALAERRRRSQRPS